VQVVLYEASCSYFTPPRCANEFSKEMNTDILPCLGLRQNFNFTDLAVNIVKSH
jgi:hypothetical protein